MSCGSDDDSGPTTDCFDCTITILGTTTTTQYCHTTGDNFVVVTQEGSNESTNVPLGELTWAQFKTANQAICEAN